MCTNILQFDPRNESDRAKIYSSYLSGGATCKTCIYAPSILDEWRPPSVYLGRKCEFLSVSTCCTSTQSCNERSRCLNANRVVMLIRNLLSLSLSCSLFFLSLSLLSFVLFLCLPFSRLSILLSFLLPLSVSPHVASQLQLAGELPFIRGDLFQFPTIPPCYCAIFP